LVNPIFSLSSLEGVGAPEIARQPSANRQICSERSCERTSGLRCLATGLRLSYSQLAMQSVASLDLTFQALSDGTRRSMIHVLARGEARSAGELGRQFRSAQPTISKHLKVLERAGLVERTIEGRIHLFRLRQKPLRDAERWIARHQAFWTGAVDQLERLLSEAARDET
jgi:DNA-binding transcriptional ArsR family regulator